MRRDAWGAPPACSARARLAVAAEQVVRARALPALARRQQEAAAELQVQRVLGEQLGAAPRAREHALDRARAGAGLHQERPALHGKEAARQSPDGRSV